jgi:hypothetical protein
MKFVQADAGAVLLLMNAPQHKDSHQLLSTLSRRGSHLTGLST